MRLEVHVESTSREMRSLHDWLRSGPDVRTTFTAAPQADAASRPGEMGPPWTYWNW
ncbi:effector-associated constant component EACC1 [Streptomyces qinglanensis]|uniref:effector-associated constant component EACC1 n=1 Tax=Streptomyces qinglanensis TaxID=943816 RepID=UPI003D74F053